MASLRLSMQATVSWPWVGELSDEECYSVEMSGRWLTLERPAACSFRRGSATKDRLHDLQGGGPSVVLAELRRCSRSGSVRLARRA
jgi:hypothetical protein